MSGEGEEIIEVQAPRSSSVGRGQAAASNSPSSVAFPRSRSSTTILLRSASRVAPNGANHTTEIKEVRENSVKEKEEEKDVEAGRTENTVLNIDDSRGDTAAYDKITSRHAHMPSADKIKQVDDRPSWDMMRHASGPHRRDVGMWRSSLVELIASLMLTFVSVSAVIACLRADFTYPRIAVAVTQFLIYTMCIVAAAPLSGGHLNPSFSFTCMLTGHMSPIRGLLYILAQSAGSVLGALFVRASIPSDIAQTYYLGGCLLKQQVLDADLNSVSFVGADYGPALVAELFFSFLLIAIALPLLILSPCPWLPPKHNPDPSHTSQFSGPGQLPPSLHQTLTSFTDPSLLRTAFIIGLLLGLLIFVSGQLLSPGYTSAGMNPARCFGPAVAEGGTDLWQPQWVFWLGPFLAGLLFAILYRIVFHNHPCRRLYGKDQLLPPQDYIAESTQAKLPLVGTSENPILMAGTQSKHASEVDDLHQRSDRMTPNPPSTDPVSRRMDVFLHIKATMQKPDEYVGKQAPTNSDTMDQSDEGTRLLSFLSPDVVGKQAPYSDTMDQSDEGARLLSIPSPVADPASAYLSGDHQHVILEQGNLSLRNLMELPSTSSNTSTLLKLERLLKDKDDF
eukprot:c13794_g1_i1 orf=581-2440(-)